MTNQIIEENKRAENAKIEDLWDCICSHIGFDENGKEIQEMIRTFVESKLQKALAQQREGFVEKVKSRLDYCQKQNGLPYCKNCGLNKEDLKSLNK